MRSSGEIAVMVVGSVTVLSADVRSPPPLRSAVLTTSDAAGDTLTGSWITGQEGAGASEWARVQVTAWPAMPQFQPLPDADTGVKPAGTLSVTVTGPPLGAVPRLSTRRR